MDVYTHRIEREHVDHPMSLQMAGLDKPRRKRGRPPKKTKAKEEADLEMIIPDDRKENNGTPDEINGKRRRKTPKRFKEIIQGKELERIFKEEGVTDGDDSDDESKHDIRPDIPPVVQKEPEVIGHLENSGELVVVVKGKGRGRPKGRLRVTREECAICGAQFSCVGRYMSHVAQHGPVRYQCNECSAVFPTRLLFAGHQADTKHSGQIILPIEDQKPEEPVESKSEDREVDPLMSDVASITNAVSAQCLPDLESIKIEAVCQPTQGASNAGNVEAKATIKVDDDCIEVVKEGNNATTSPGIDVETVDVETYKNTTKEKAKLKCNHCDKMFSNKQSKSLHTKAVHGGERAYACKECGARFAYPRSLSLHMLSHRRRPASRGFACDLCGKVLNHPSSVVYHKEAEHAGQRYVCGKCGKSFKHKQLLKRHQLVHSQLRPYTCKTCNSSFKTKANLLNHQLLHSGVKRFSCELCKHRFAHKTSLTLHMRWHTGQKPFSCGKCGKSFSQKGNLYEHERIHTGEKPYECGLCLRRFTTSSQHRLHLRRHALDNQPKRTTTRRGKVSDIVNGGEDVVAVADEVPEGSKPSAAAANARHQCGTCGRAFSTRAALRRHLRRHAVDSPGLHRHRKQVHKQENAQASLLATGAVEGIVGAPLGMLNTAMNTVVNTTMGTMVGTTMDGVNRMDNVVATPMNTIVGTPMGALMATQMGAVVGNMGSVVGNMSAVVGNMGMDAVGTGPVVEVGGESPTSCDEHVIYVAYDLDDEHAFTQQVPEVSMVDKMVSPYSSPPSAHHLPVTDEEGNPLHFTMEDGTQLAITLADGKSLQIVTQDGQTIPVEINSYTESEEGVASTQAIVHQLEAPKEEVEHTTQAGHYFTLSNLSKM